MRYPLFFIFPFVLAAARSLACGIQAPGKSEGRAAISAETEYGFLLVAIFCLTGLLITLGAMIYFPDLGAVNRGIQSNLIVLVSHPYITSGRVLDRRERAAAGFARRHFGRVLVLQPGKPIRPP